MLKQTISYSSSVVYSAFLLCIRTIECGLLAPLIAWNLFRCCFGHFEDASLTLGVPPSFFTDLSASINSSQARSAKKNHLFFHSYLLAPMLFAASAYKKTRLPITSREQPLHARLRSILHIVLFACLSLPIACIMTPIYILYYTLWHTNNTQRIFKARVQKSEAVNNDTKSHAASLKHRETPSKERGAVSASPSSILASTHCSTGSSSHQGPSLEGAWARFEKHHIEHLDKIIKADTTAYPSLKNVTPPKWLQKSLAEIAILLESPHVDIPRLPYRMPQHTDTGRYIPNIGWKPNTTTKICIKLEEPSETWDLFMKIMEKNDPATAASISSGAIANSLTADQLSPISHKVLTQKPSQHAQSAQGSTSRTCTTKSQHPSALPLRITYKP